MRLSCERPLTGSKASQPAHDRVQRAAGGQRAGRRGQRVAHVVPAGHAQRQRRRGRPACSAAAAQWSPLPAAPAPSRRPRRRARSCITRRAPARPRHSGACASSAGNTATPSAGSAAITLPFSRATASTLAMNSWCSRCALLTSATVGAAMAASWAISPGWFMPSSTTAARCAASAQAQQRQRHADVVVQVALGGQRRLAQPGAQDAPRSSA